MTPVKLWRPLVGLWPPGWEPVQEKKVETVRSSLPVFSQVSEVNSQCKYWPAVTESTIDPSLPELWTTASRITQTSSWTTAQVIDYMRDWLTAADFVHFVYSCFNPPARSYQLLRRSRPCVATKEKFVHSNLCRFTDVDFCKTNI